MTGHALAHGFCDRCGNPVAAGDPVAVLAEGVVCNDCKEAAEQ